MKSNEKLKDTSATANLWERQSLFRALNPVLSMGFDRALELRDLPPLPYPLRSINSLQYLQSHTVVHSNRGSLKTSWLEEPDPALSKKALWSLLGLLWSAHGRSFLVLGVLKVFMLGSSFAGPLLLSLMISYLDSAPTQARLVEGLILVAGLGGSFVFSALVNTQFNIRTSILQVKIKGALTCAVFARALVLPLYACTDLDMSDGKLTTLIQIDVDRISGCASSLHDLWMLPVQIIITFVLLYQQVQSAFLAGICIIVVMFPINKSITERIMAATKGQLGCKDKRVTLMSEALRGVKSVKMLGLEEAVSNLSAASRADEFRFLSTRKYLDACCVFLWASTPVLVPFSTFAVSTCLLHRKLTVSEVFTTIALLSMLVFPLNAFPWVLNGCVEAGVSVARVAKVLSDSDGCVGLGVPEAESVTGTETGTKTEAGPEEVEEETNMASVEEEETVGKDSMSPALLSVSGAQFAWTVPNAAPTPPSNHKCCPGSCWPCCQPSSNSNSNSNSKKGKNERVSRPADVEQGLGLDSAAVGPEVFALPLLTFSGRAGSAYAVVGPVASGKSTLLLGALGEVRLSSTSGEVRVLGVRRDAKSESWSLGDVAVAFCSQVPVMHAGTVRSNILFGSPMEPRRYRRVLEGCGLLQDMALKTWPRGDLINVGHGGGALSGGQRLRVGVARALYSKARIVLLDAPFSALDHDTASRLLQWLVHEAASSKRLVMLASHSVSLLRGHCSDVLLLQRGLSVTQGSFAELERSNTVFQGLLGGERGGTPGLESMDTESEETTAGKQDEATSAVTGKAENEAEAEPIEAMATGRIGMPVYWAYFRAMGPLTCGLVLFTTLCMQASADGMALWYAHWAEHAGELRDSQFLTFTGAIAGGNVLFALLRSFIFAFGGLRAARRFYASLTSAVLSTDLAFFEETSIGRILNRFGKDTDVIDDQLPFMLNIVLAQVFVLVGSFAVISYSNPPILVMLVVVGLLYWRLQHYYRATSRGLRRLDAVQRSPVYTLLQDCLANATTIRAMQRAPVFRRQLRVALDRLLTVNMTSAAAAQWLSIRLQLLGALIATSIALLSTVGSTTGLLRVSPALLGVSLVYSLSIVGKLNGLVGSLTETEQEMVSVERCAEYLSLNCEFDEPVGGAKADMRLRVRHLADSDGSGTMSTNESDSITAPLLAGATGSSSSAKSRIGTISSEALEGWPSCGAISFSGLCMRYPSADSLAPDALSGVTVDIAAGSRVAVMGRTGSGKSTMLRVLLGISDYYCGSVTIDGVELGRVPRDVLRSRLSIIPQDPFVLSGPLRLSLDPWNRHDDEVLARALRDCGFVETVSNIDSGAETIPPVAQSNSAALSEQEEQRRAIELLDMPLTDGGRSLSLGQRQLICLGRALLRGSRVVLLDEFSSSVDPRAELLLYSVLKKHAERSGSTLLVITHRDPPEACGQLLTMAQGRVVSFSDRQKL